MLTLLTWALIAIIAVGLPLGLYTQSHPRLSAVAAASVVAAFAALGPLMAATGDPIVGAFFAAIAVGGVLLLVRHIQANRADMCSICGATYSGDHCAKCGWYATPRGAEVEGGAR
jgi:hypothetical protein